MNWLLPVITILLLFIALIRRVDPYSAFIEGAAEAIPTLVRILPNLAAIMIAVSVFKGSGALDALTKLAAPAAQALGIPPEIVHLLLLRPFSGSASLGILSDILSEYGADSFIGNAASVCVGSTETIVYVITLYCGSVGITRTRHAFTAAIVSGAVGVLTGIAMVRLLLT